MKKNLIRGLAAGTVLASASLLMPLQASAADYDPAHHSTDLNDPDPAHHRPILLFSASTGQYVLTPIAGFDLNGYRLGSPGSGAPVQPPTGYSTDPAHHSSDLNDPDPAHHRPIWVYDSATKTGKLVPIPGFDINGYRLTSSAFS